MESKDSKLARTVAATKMTSAALDTLFMRGSRRSVSGSNQASRISPIPSGKSMVRTRGIAMARALTVAAGAISGTMIGM
ncbi:MAG: hypothetical protein HUU14_05075 [Dehalococcoidia bacterium]|nr:hypothetical protein [Dehalococcoidia bacterium]